MLDLALFVEGEEVWKVGEVEFVDCFEEEVAFLAEEERTHSLEL